MKYTKLFLIFGFVASLAFSVQSYQPEAAELDSLVAAAKQEGGLNFYAQVQLTPKGAEALGESFNKKYGLNVKLKFFPSANMSSDIAAVVQRVVSGLPPEWDLMAVPDSYHAPLMLRNMHRKFDYRMLGVAPNAIQYDNGTVAFAHGFVLPAFNTRILPTEQAPQKWEDLLEPKFGNGKLGVSNATHHFARLAMGPWGEAKTTKFVKALAAQKPYLGRLPELLTRLQIGEILIAADMKSSIFYQAAKAGSPIVQPEKFESIISPDVEAGVMKDASHPNVAHLFAAFLVSPEAQRIWETYNGESSAFIPGTPANKFVQGKLVVFMKDKDAPAVDKLSLEYAKIFGFQ